ncbi:MAG: hypothetical protein PHE53_05920 [Thermoguttaceae bacterium]|nr:hypothetical protein [Thermoguttaceae bacterium]
MVQIPEVCDEKSEAYKAGYKNIYEIGEERIRRAGKKIQEDLTAKRSTEQRTLFDHESPDASLDIGFRILRVDSTNMENVYYHPEDYQHGQTEAFVENIKPDRTPEDLLMQVMLELGVPLSSEIQEMEIAGKKVFSVADGYLIACFDENVTDETVTEIAKRRPYYAVFRDNGMAKDSVVTNFDQIFEAYSPKTQRKVL